MEIHWNTGNSNSIAWMISEFICFLCSWYLFDQTEEFHWQCLEFLLERLGGEWIPSINDKTNWKENIHYNRFYSNFDSELLVQISINKQDHLWWLHIQWEKISTLWSRTYIEMKSLTKTKQVTWVWLFVRILFITFEQYVRISSHWLFITFSVKAFYFLINLLYY